MFSNDVWTKLLGQPLSRIEKFKLSRKKKDDTLVNAIAADIFVSSFLDYFKNILIFSYDFLLMIFNLYVD